MRGDLRRRLRPFYPQLLLAAVFLLFVIVLSFLSDHFLTWKNLKNIAEANSFRLLLALGMTVVMSSAAIDLSAGSIVSLSGIIMAGLISIGWDVSVAIVIGLIGGILMGALNGYVIAKSRLSPFIVTLAFMSIYRGLSLIVTEGIPITKLPAAFRFWGRSDIDKLNPPLIIAAVAFLFLIPFMARTKPGQYILASGGSEEALRRQGVNTAFYRVLAHAILGFTAAITGLIVTARLNSAEANAGIGMDIDAITAVIMGGTPLSGGRAHLVGSLIAVLLLGTIRNGLTIMSVSSYYQQFFSGVLLLVSVLLAKRREQTLV